MHEPLDHHTEDPFQSKIRKIPHSYLFHFLSFTFTLFCTALFEIYLRVESLRKVAFFWIVLITIQSARRLYLPLSAIWASHRSSQGSSLDWHNHDRWQRNGNIIIQSLCNLEGFWCDFFTMFFFLSTHSYSSRHVSDALFSIQLIGLLFYEPCL